MSWSKIDDLLPHHRKVRAMGADAFAAFGVYVTGICFAQREFTDGVILRSDLPALVPGRVVPPRLIPALVTAGLWDALGDGRDGWRIHDYLDHNDSAAVRRDKLARDAARKRGLESPWNPNVVRTESGRTPDVAPSSSSPSSSEKLPLEKLRRVGGEASADGEPTKPATGHSRDQGGSDGADPSPCAVAEVTVGHDTAYRCAETGRTWSQGSTAPPRCPGHRAATGPPTAAALTATRLGHA